MIKDSVEYRFARSSRWKLVEARDVCLVNDTDWLSKAQIDALTSIIADLDTQLEEYVERRTEEWHNGAGAGYELWEYLGLAREEYSKWVTKPSSFVRGQRDV